MRTHVMISGVFIIALLLTTLGWQLSAPAGAQSGGGFELIRSTTASSILVAAGGYAVNASVGQFEAGDSNGGGYSLSGGFWGGPSTNSPALRTFIPFLTK